MPKPFLSVIIPAYNESKRLPLTLIDVERHLAEAEYSWEIVVVNGGSSDATAEITNRFSHLIPNLRLLDYQENHGKGWAVREGMLQAHGNWRLFMDADNRLPPYFLQGIKYRWESDPTDLATTWIESDKNKPYDDTIAKTVNYATELAKNFKTPFFTEAMTICSAPAFAGVKGFDETVNYAESRQIASSILRLGYKYKIYKDPPYTYSFRRIRKYGPINLAAKMAQHQLSALLDLQLSPRELREFYPMKGGTFFDKPYRKKRQFIKTITKLLKDF